MFTSDRRIYALLASLATENDQELLLFIKKQIRNYDPKVQRVGIVGAAQAIGVIGAAGRDHLINSSATQDNSFSSSQGPSRSTQELMGQSTCGTRRFRIVKHLFEMCSSSLNQIGLVNDELGKIISQKKMDKFVIKYIRDKMWSLFSKKWLVHPEIPRRYLSNCPVPGINQFGMSSEDSMLEESGIEQNIIDIFR